MAATTVREVVERTTARVYPGCDEYLLFVFLIIVHHNIHPGAPRLVCKAIGIKGYMVVFVSDLPAVEGGV